MNIFKVFASAKKGFQEEYSSAILAWLLNPTMEHGLGYAFLSKFLNALDEGRLASKLRNSLRNNSRNIPDCKTFLELNVEKGFIDIVINIDVDGEKGEKLTVAIENKIFGTSASDPDQLIREYQGLKEMNDFKNRRVIMVFLVPVDPITRKLNKMVEAEWANFEKHWIAPPNKKDDKKCRMTWGEMANSSDKSIVQIISELLEEENKGEIQPLNEYMRHTLKALVRFIADGFSGYLYEPEESSKNDYFGRKRPDELLLLSGPLFVGVPGGINGLIRIICTVGLRNYNGGFMYGKTKNNDNWLSLSEFKDLATLDQDTLEHREFFAWLEKRGIVKSIPTDLISFIATRVKETIYVGIKGGENGLQKMSTDDILKTSRSISTKIERSGWIDAKKVAERLQI